eukprot:UN11653
MVFCDGNISDNILFAGYTLFSAILLTVSVLVMHKFIIHQENHKELSKILYYTQLLFCITTTIHLIVSCIFYPYIFCNGFIYNGGIIVELVIYFASYFILINLFYLVLFMKLYYVFEQSVYRMHSTTVKLWIILFIISPCLYVLWLFLDQVGFQIIDFVVIWFWGIMIPVSLLISFIHKLFQVYRLVEIQSRMMLNDESVMDDRILSTITKPTILALISIPFTIIMSVTLVLVHED